MIPFRIARPRFLAYFTLELGLVLAVVAGLGRLTLHWTPPPQAAAPGLTILLITALFCGLLFSTQWANLGDDGGLVREIVVFGIVSLVVGVVTVAATWVLLGAGHWKFPALLALEGAVAVPAAVAAWRWVSVRMRVFNAPRERVLIVGTGEMARQVCRWIATHHSAEYGVVGFAHEDDSREGTVLAMGVRVQTDFASLPGFAPGRCDRLIVALDEKRGRFPVQQLMELRLLGLEIEEAPSFFERISGKIPVETMLPSWLIFSEGFKSSALRSLLKRAADLTLATLLLIFTAPLLLFSAVLIKLTSRGPVLYRQRRLGQGAREFDLLKFRSMIADAEAESGPMWTQAYDERITLAGLLLRPLRVDELPQLINVLRGEMSFVGPRPERPHFVRQLQERIPYYGLRMTVRPGITGWAQVEYRYGASDEDALEKLKYDLYYIKNSNLLLDLWIILKTSVVVLFGKGAR